MPLLFAPYYLTAYLVTAQIVARVPASWLERTRLNFTLIVRHLLSFAMIGVTAAIAIRLLEIFSTLSRTGRRTFGWALLMVLSPPVMSHSFLFFTEIISAFIALTVFMWLRGAPHSRFEALLAGAAVGYLLLIHAKNAGLIAGIIALAAVESRRWSDRSLLAPFLGGAAALLAVRMTVNHHLWGGLITTPHVTFAQIGGWQPFVAESATRVAGWLFDQEYGLLPNAPVYLLVPAGWFALWRRDRRLCGAITLVVCAYVGVMAAPVLNAHGWRSGWSPAARYLVPVAPFLAILVFSAVSHLRRLPVIVLAIVAIQVCLDAIVWQRPGLLWNDGIGTSALMRFLDRDTGWLSLYVPSIIAPISGRTLATIGAASIGWLVLTLWLTAREENGQGPAESGHDVRRVRSG